MDEDKRSYRDCFGLYLSSKVYRSSTEVCEVLRVSAECRGTLKNRSTVVDLVHVNTIDSIQFDIQYQSCMSDFSMEFVDSSDSFFNLFNSIIAFNSSFNSLIVSLSSLKDA